MYEILFGNYKQRDTRVQPMPIYMVAKVLNERKEY